MGGREKKSVSVMLYFPGQTQFFMVDFNFDFILEFHCPNMSSRSNNTVSSIISDKVGVQVKNTAIKLDKTRYFNRKIPLTPHCCIFIHFLSFLFQWSCALDLKPHLWYLNHFPLLFFAIGFPFFSFLR